MTVYLLNLLEIHADQLKLITFSISIFAHGEKTKSVNNLVDVFHQREFLEKFS